MSLLINIIVSKTPGKLYTYKRIVEVYIVRKLVSHTKKWNSAAKWVVKKYLGQYNYNSRQARCTGVLRLLCAHEGFGVHNNDENERFCHFF